MATALYNPRFVESEGRKTLNTADVKRFVWSHATWNLKVNEIKKFPDEVAQAMLRHMEFLIEVTPKNIEQIKKDQAVKQFKCPECNFETDLKMALGGHMKTHGITEEHDKMLGEIEEAQPSAKYQGFRLNKTAVSPEQREGIPDTANGPMKDRDGVEFYGEGLTEDEGGFVKNKKTYPGQFKG